MSSAQIQSLKTYLKNASITYTEEWLDACVTWVKDNYNPITDAFLKEQVYEQWKDINLEEMESRCLPVNLQGQRCTRLSGKYSLQINSVQDIGESAYSQWTRIKKLENANTDVSADSTQQVPNTWAPKPRRCLYLTMTDGTQQVFGLELNHIPCLSLELQPGVKVLIVGPVECRRGVLQLKPCNVKILGGEVDELVMKNSVEALLRERLHKPPGDNEELQAPARQNNVVNDNNANIIGEFPASMSDDEFPEFGDDDDIFMEIDENELIASAANSTTSNNISTTTRASMNSESRRNAETQRIVFDTSHTTTMSSMEIGRRVQSSTSNTSSIRRDSNDSTNMPPPPQVQNRPNVASAVDSAKKTKKFVPPPPSSSITSTAKSNKGSTSSTDKPRTVQGLGVFKTAKSLMPHPASTSSGIKKKQLKIDGYMKPMPVVIKPPTPVRLADRRPVRDAPLNAVESFSIDHEAETEIIDRFEVESEDDEEDDSLMDIIEESFEAELERVDNENIVRATNEQTKQTTSSSLSSYSTVKSPPTGIVRPTTIPSKMTLPIIVTKQPYVYLKQVNDNWDVLSESREVVFVKACVSTVVSNIQVNSGNWTLSVSINDGTGFLNCRISSDLLNDIIGFSPTEMKQMKATKTKEAKERIAHGMKTLTATLVHLNAILGIEVGPDPLITEFRDVMSHHLGALKARVTCLP